MKYVTMEREYGSGATQIARELAKRCSIPCYGEEILEEASKRLDMSPDQMRDCEEKATNSFLYSLYALSQSQSGGDMVAKETKVHVEEQRAIQEFAKKGAAVFIGHCAAEALKEEEGVLRVFIFADEASKNERIQKEYGVAKGQVESVARKMNRRRAAYFAANTQEKWDDFRNYDIVLNSGALGIAGCVNVLAELLKG